MKEKNRKIAAILTLIGVLGIIAVIYTYPRAVVNFVEPLKNGEELECIWIVHEKFDDPKVVQITDQDTILNLKEQLEKVRVRYWRRDEAVLYSEDNYLLVVEFNHPDHRIIFQKDGTVYWDDKLYFPVDGESVALFELLEKVPEEVD